MPEDTNTQPAENVPAGNPGSGRFAVYDTSLQRYVGGVQDSKPSKSDADKLAPKGHSIVEV